MAGYECVRVSEKLDFDTFEFQFENLHYATERHRTYVIFDVKPQSAGGRSRRLWGYIINNPNVCHAELILMSMIDRHLESNPGVYAMTWYMSWSPCANCSSKLNPWLKNLLEEQGHTLTMHFSRIYDRDREGDHRGLRGLKHVSNSFRMGVVGRAEVKECLAEYVEASRRTLTWLDTTESMAAKMRRKLFCILVRCAGMRESGIPLHLFTLQTPLLSGRVVWWRV
uniref:Cytidine deaminase n=1 Tax=Petromyzon marinus TaxID=7757 RepID=A0A2P1IQ93_PETMA|nr:cytidine deaminase [Petromyzon marinus]